MKKSDLDLGMNRPITRRDFLNGASVAVGGVGAIGAASMPSGGVDATEAGSTHQGPGPFGDEYYPPKLTGMRGSHEGRRSTSSVSPTSAFRAATTTPSASTGG